MCEPATIAATIAVIGAGMSSYATYQAGQSQKRAAEYNNKILQQRALDAEQKGSMEGVDFKQKARSVASAQRSAAAASGVEVDTGTVLDLTTETAGMGELDALRARNNAVREAYGYRTEGELELYQGKQAARGATMNAVGSFLGNASGSYFGAKKSSSAAA